MESKKALEINLGNVSVNLRTYLLFLKLVESLSDNPEDYKALLHPEVRFTEFPNALNKNGQVRNLEASLEGLKKARMILSKQVWEIGGYTESQNRLMIEKIWSGEMSMDVGNLKKGQELKSYVCAVVEFKDGRIYRHRTYDCYEPFN